MRRLLIACAVLAAAAAARADQVQRPTFSSRLDVLAVDVSALAEDGTPIQGLTPADFVVRVDGAVRKVLSADFVRLDTVAAGLAGPGRIADNREAPERGRFIFIVIDDASFAAGDEKAPIAAVLRFIEKLRPADRVGLALTSSGAIAAPTRDRAAVRAALGKVAGGWDIKAEVTSGTYLGLSEAVDITQGNRNAFIDAVARICGRRITSSDLGTGDPCVEEVETSAQRLSDSIRGNALLRTRNLGDIVRSLSELDGQKALVMISGGLIVPGELEPIQRLASDAAAANVTLHTIYVDSSFAGDARQQSPQVRLRGDLTAATHGLETLAGMARGSFQRLVGAGAGVFDRVARETSAVYRLGVQASAADFDGRTRRLEVRMAREGAIVRAHRHVVGTARAEAETAEARLKRAVRALEPERAVPVRLTHFAFPADAGRVRIVLAGEASPSVPGAASAMYHVVDPRGRVIDSRFAARLGDETRAPGTPLMVHADLVLLPGQYAARLAVLDGSGAIGVAEYAFAAELTTAGPLTVGDVMFFSAGVPVQLAPRDSLPAGAPGFTAYVEVGGSGEGAFSITFELVDATGTRRASHDVPLAFSGTPSKAGAKAEFSTAGVAPGSYVLAAIVRGGDTVLGRVATPLTIAR
ncbi:MAG: hypothetical protein M3R55_03685 [Acidobacteriota bacterium]|nr:hypothetical protein [Acidobacteriota bacterium]